MSEPDSSSWGQNVVGKEFIFELSTPGILTPGLKGAMESELPRNAQGRSVTADDGMVVSWGRGEDGQLGHGDANERPLPQTIHSLKEAQIDSIYCGAEYSAAVSYARKEVYSWGW